MAKEKDSQARKYQITINEPNEKGLTPEAIDQRLQSLAGLLYYCRSEEIGNDTGRHHAHIFVIYENAKRFSTMKKLFPEAHFESAKGSNEQNRDYVLKAGKWAGTEKADTRIDGTQAEWGALPPERHSSKPELEILYELIRDGKTNFEIINAFPEYIKDITTIEQCRRIIKQAENADIWRDVDVTYIFGKTGTGKTRYVMEKYGYSNVFRVTDYLHPFDTYEQQDVVLFEEFNSSLRITDMLNYLDGYPLKLPARYSDKIACYTKVFLTSNIPLEDQYPDIRAYKSRETWDAFARRIRSVIHYHDENQLQVYKTAKAYLERNTPLPEKPCLSGNGAGHPTEDGFVQLALGEATPFDETVK